MLILLLATILILAMTAFFVTQGLFSSMIAAVLSVICAAFALNAYPALASIVLYDTQGPIANATALMALFVLSLIASKELADAIIPRNLQFSVLADRIGGGVFGLVASMTMVGMVLVIVQMLPLGESVFGYKPYDDSLRRTQQAWPFFSDDFAVALGEIGSVGAFGGEGSFNHVHQDLLQEAAAARKTAGTGGTTFARPNSMRVRGTYLPTAAQLTDALKPEGGIPNDPLVSDPLATRPFVACVTIDSTCGDSDENTRLVGTQFRLVTRTAEESGKSLTGPPIDHYPVGWFFLKDDHWEFVAAPVENDKTQIGKLLGVFKSNSIPDLYLVYKIGDKQMPDYLAFRQVSVAAIRKPKMNAMPETPGKPAAKPEKSTSKKK